MNSSSMMAGGVNFVKEAGFLLWLRWPQQHPAGQEEERVGSVFNLTESICSQKHITFIRLAEIKTQTELTREFSSHSCCYKATRHGAYL